MLTARSFWRAIPIRSLFRTSLSDAGPRTRIEHAPAAAFRRRPQDADRTRSRRYVQGTPDLAVEVMSPSDRPSDIARKQGIYARAGVPLVWWVDPVRRVIGVQRDGIVSEEVGMGGELDGGDVLPGFRLVVDEVFAVV